MLGSDQTRQAPRNPEPESKAADATGGPETHLDQAAAHATWLTPSFTPGTLLLILNAGQATWTPIWEVIRGATAIQSLPSGSTGDVSGAQLATIEKVCTFGWEGGAIDIVQLGKAQITMHHPILTADGWMTARQAVAKGHGQVLSDRIYPNDV